MNIEVDNGYCATVATTIDKRLARKRVIHILDLDGEVTVTSSIERLQYPILNQLLGEEAGKRPSDFSWILYHTDAVISEFDGSFKHVAADDKRVHAEYVMEMKKRYTK